MTHLCLIVGMDISSKFSQKACSKCSPTQNTRFKETNCQLLPSDLSDSPNGGHLYNPWEGHYFKPPQKGHERKNQVGWFVSEKKHPENQPTAWRCWGDPNHLMFSQTVSRVTNAFAACSCRCILVETMAFWGNPRESLVGRFWVGAAGGRFW